MAAMWRGVRTRFIWMSRPGVTARLTIMMVLAVVCVAAVVGASIVTTRGQLLQERVRQSRSLVETVAKVIDSYAQREASGELTREQAQAQAVDTVRLLRYDGSNYFWINDMAPRMVVQPTQPELDGTDL